MTFLQIFENGKKAMVQYWVHNYCKIKELCIPYINARALPKNVNMLRQYLDQCTAPSHQSVAAFIVLLHECIAKILQGVLEISSLWDHSNLSLRQLNSHRVPIEDKGISAPNKIKKTHFVLEIMFTKVGRKKNQKHNAFGCHWHIKNTLIFI